MALRLGGFVPRQPSRGIPGARQRAEARTVVHVVDRATGERVTYNVDFGVETIEDIMQRIASDGVNGFNIPVAAQLLSFDDELLKSDSFAETLTEEGIVHDDTLYLDRTKVIVKKEASEFSSRGE